MMKKIGLWILLLLAPTVFAEGLITKVIHLNYRPANEVITLVKPLLQSGEEITGSGQTLIVKLSPTTLTQLRAVLHSIDVPPVTFNVTIFQGPADWLSAQNDNTTTISTASTSNQQSTQSVKVMSGESAFVSMGEEIPVVTSVGAGFWTGVDYQQHQTQRGLLVQPSLAGNQVKLKIKRIRSQENSQMHGSQQFENQNIATTLMLPLNKWVALGSSENASTSKFNEVSYSVGNRFADSATLYIKVTTLR
jgi:hypothetical protein